MCRVELTTKQAYKLACPPQGLYNLPKLQIQNLMRGVADESIPQSIQEWALSINYYQRQHSQLLSNLTNVIEQLEKENDPEERNKLEKEREVLDAEFMEKCHIHRMISSAQFALAMLYSSTLKPE